MFDRFFCNFLGINTHNFVKNDPKFKDKDFFMQNIMDLGMKKDLYPKAMTSGVWGLKISLGKLRSKRHVKP